MNYETMTEVELKQELLKIIIQLTAEQVHELTEILKGCA